MRHVIMKRNILKNMEIRFSVLHHCRIWPFLHMAGHGNSRIDPGPGPGRVINFFLS